MRYHRPRPSATKLVVWLSILVLSAAASGALAAVPSYRADTDTWRLGDLPLAETRSTVPDPADPDVTWSITPNLRIHPQETGQHIWVDIAQAPDGTLGAAWMDDHAPAGYHIFYCYSTDFGATWSMPEQVDDRIGAGAYSKFVSLAFTPSGVAVAVWEDDRNGQIQLYFSKRAGGPSPPWLPAVQVNAQGGPPSGADFMNGSIAVLDDVRYFVAWTDWREGVFHQVYMRGTWDGGVTWGPEARVSDGLGYEPVAGDPCLVVDPSSGPVPGQERLYCVTNDWRGNVPGGRYPNVYFYRSQDGGATWSIGVRVNDVEPYYQQTASHGLVQVGGADLAAGWLNDPDFTGSRYHVNVSHDGGVTWEPGVRVSEPALGSNDTYDAIATSGGWLFAAFGAYSSSWDLYFRASSDGGATWTEPSVHVDDDATGAASHTPILVAESTDQVYIAWQDTRAPGNNWKIYTAAASAQTTAIEATPVAGGPPVWRALPNPSRVGSQVLLRAIDPAADGGRMPVTAGVYDVHGRLVRRLLPRASERLLWDGRDEHGRPAPAGCYFVRGLPHEPAAGTVLVRVR